MSRASAEPFTREFFARSALAVAPELLNAVLSCGGRSGRIVEVEAYQGDVDPASHAFRGQTARNTTMFGPPGHLYVYFTYGMHFCANIVCSPSGEASAVLIRALRPLIGLEEMRVARGGVRDADLCSGPAKLCQALAIDRRLDGADLLEGGPVRLERDATRPPAAPLVGVRVGLSARVGEAIHWPWRFAVPEEPWISRPIRQPSA